VSDKFLVFDIWSQYAHFKKPYTTTSPLTFSLPPRTVISGILAAIAGIDKNEYISCFSKDLSDIAIGIRKPVKKVRIAENLINTKESMTRIFSRTQIRIEFLKNPKYRVYFNHSCVEIYNKLKKMLENHASFYTVSLGLSENLANYEYIGEFESIKKDLEEQVFISSVIPLDVLKKSKLLITDEAEYFTENIPVEMTEQRKTIQFREVLFERNAKRIKAFIADYVELKGLGESIIVL
jgi:CRISPR-associated protein Cas5h